MNIRHQKVIGNDGEPSAAIIPWKIFQQVQSILSEEATPDEIEAMEEAENDRKNGNDDAFTSLADLKAELAL